MTVLFGVRAHLCKFQFHDQLIKTDNHNWYLIDNGQWTIKESLRDDF